MQRHAASIGLSGSLTLSGSDATNGDRRNMSLDTGSVVSSVGGFLNILISSSDDGAKGLLRINVNISS